MHSALDHFLFYLLVCRPWFLRRPMRQPCLLCRPACQPCLRHCLLMWLCLFFPPVSALFSLPPCLSALFFVLPCTLALLSVLLSSYVALFFFLFFNNIYNLSFEPFKKLYLFTIWLLFLPPVYWFIFSLYNADVLSYIRNYFFLLSYSIFHSFIDVFTQVNLSEKNGYSFQGFVFSFLNPVSYNFTMFLFLLISSLYLNWKILHWFISEITSDEFLLFFCELAKIIT